MSVVDKFCEQLTCQKEAKQAECDDLQAQVKAACDVWEQMKKQHGENSPEANAALAVKVTLELELANCQSELEQVCSLMTMIGCVVT